MEGGKSSNFIFNLTLILIGLFSVFFYQIAWGWPIVDSYPQVERLLDSDYLKNDFYTNTFEEFSPRLYIAYFYIYGSYLFNIDYTNFIGYLNLLRIFLLTISVFVFLRALSGNKYIALIGCFIGSVSFYSIPKTVAWFFSTPVFTAAEFSLIFIIFGLTLIYKSKIPLGLLLFSIAMFFHPVITAHGIALAGILYISKYGFKHLKNLVNISSVLSLIVLISVFLLSYLPYKSSLKGLELLSSEEFTQINATIRHPHHYIPSAFGLETWFIFILYIVTFFYMIYMLRDQMAQHIYRFLKYYLFFLGLAMVAGYLFVEVYPVKLIVTLTPYRFMVFFSLIYLLVYSSYMHYKFKNKDYVSFLLLHIPFIPFITENVKVSTLAIVIAFSYAILNDILLKNNIRLKIYVDEYIFEKINLKYFYLILITVAIAASYLFLDKNLRFNTPNIDEKENEIYLWLNEETPKDATILSEINVDDLVNQKIRLLAKRAIPSSKDFPFNEQYYKEWSERYLEVYDGVYENKGYIDNLTVDELNRISEKYNINYILRTKKLNQSEYFKLEDTIQLFDRKIFIYSRKEV
ncbi:DUF6798 domain-containing protein [Jeotgalibacillus marinus]|uniref:DUF6798 domain-containing protein n=1 Tax=Jeotgalibacillus marinus TaxID=86667 RepID=A0ABV3Q2I5_9BACL